MKKEEKRKEDKHIHPTLVKPTKFGQRAADSLTAAVGSWAFIIFFLIILIAWIMVNASWIIFNKSWDPYPFILLNLVLSCVAAGYLRFKTNSDLKLRFS